MHLEQFCDILCAHLYIDGCLSGMNKYINAHIKRELREGNITITTDMTVDGIRVFGRSETPSLDEAIADLSKKISGKIIKFGKTEFVVPHLSWSLPPTTPIHR